MSRYRIVKSVLLGVCGTGTAVAISYNKLVKERKVNASWTTHHATPEPVQKWDDNWDRRHVPKTEVDQVDASGDGKPKGRPTATRHIILIRHGQYNLKGESDEFRTLSDLGKEQADMTGARLKAYNIPFNKIVYSTMTRATETGKIISSHIPDIPVEYCSLIREGAPIPPEPPLGSWRPEAHFYEDGARIEAGFRKHIHRADVEQKETSYEVIVCHANVIRYFVCRALQLPPEAWLRISLHNGSMTWLTVRPSGYVSLRGLGDCGFMDIDKLTTT